MRFIRPSFGSKRARRGGKRLDLFDLKSAIRDGEIWTGVGVVATHDGEPDHFEIDQDEHDVLISVNLMPWGEPLRCRLGAAAGGPGMGVWMIPPVGTEVAVAIPLGELEADPIILCALSSGVLPYGLDGATMVIAVAPGQKVLIHDGSGGAEPLVRKSEFDAHTHKLPALQVTNVQGGTAILPITSTIAAKPIFPTDQPDAITGTVVLVGK